MATLNLTTETFSDIMLIYLFDQIMNPEQIDNENTKEFIEKHSSKLKAPLIKYYLDTNMETRRQYKMIKGIFDGSDKSIQQIRIGPNDKIENIKKEKQGIIKRVVKKILRKEEISIENKQILEEIFEIENLKGE